MQHAEAHAVALVVLYVYNSTNLKFNLDFWMVYKFYNLKVNLNI